MSQHEVRLPHDDDRERADGARLLILDFDGVCFDPTTGSIVADPVEP